MRRLLLLLVCATIAVTSGRAQTPARTAPEAQPTFRAETTLVEVSAVVTDRAGDPVTDLEAGDFEIFENGERQSLVGFRFLHTDASATTTAVHVPGARVETIRSSTGNADAPVFVLLLDDLNVALKRSHRVIRGAKGLLAQIPPQALLGVLSTSGIDGTALTLTAPGPEHVARVDAFRGRMIEQAIQRQTFIQTPSSLVGTPCGVGSHAANSSSCADPARAVRRLETLRNVADLLATAGSRRKVLFWVTEDMGATVVDPTEGRRAQFEAFRTVLSADVAVYPVHPDELPAVPEPDPGGVLMLGGNAVSITTDELAGVTLDQMARESGGRWIVDINDHEVVLAQVVKQNSTAYMLAYESTRTRAPGRHRIDVRVRRPGVRVYARRGFVVPDTPTSTPPGQERATTHAILGDLLRSIVPKGPLELHLLVTPMLADGKVGKAFVTLQVDEASALGQPVDLALLTYDDSGAASNQHTLRLSPPATEEAWEVALELPLRRGTHQLRAAAVTADGTRSGVVVERVEIVEPGRDLWASPPMLLTVDATSADGPQLHPTLRRTADAGAPLALQGEVAGRPVADGRATVTARLVSDEGTTVREGVATLEQGHTKNRGRATAILPTAGLPAGSYALVWEVGVSGQPDTVRHALPITLRAAPTATATSADAAPTPLAVAHGPVSSFDEAGTHVIRTAAEWQAFWRHLPTRQSPPDIDFDRVTLLAVVLDQTPDTVGQQPRVETTWHDAGTLIVSWSTTPSAARGQEPRKPFVVVGITGHVGPVRFERVP